MFRPINPTRTKVFGIYFMSDENMAKKVNDVIKGTKLIYIPSRIKMNVYFTDRFEAMKVVQELNTKNNNRVYRYFITTLETLEHKRKCAENDKKLQKKSPMLYHRLTGYRIYKSAQEYLDLKNTQTSHQAKEDSLIK